MKPLVRTSLVLGTLGGLAGLVLFTATNLRPGGEPSSASSAPAPSVSTPAKALAAATEDPAPNADTAPAPTAPSAAEPPLPVGEAAHEAITELAVTYDAVSVPALARYLGHSDPEVRSAARDGLVQLGERAAIRYLEAAAKTAPADEAKELRDAAEFLALPTWTERRAAQKKAKAAAAGTGAP